MNNKESKLGEKDVANDGQYFIEKIKVLSKELGKTPNCNDYRIAAKKNGWAINYKKFFKKWNSLIEACVLIKLVNFFDRNEFIKNLKEYYDLSGGDLSFSGFKDFCIEKNYNKTFMNYYKTWDKALADAGFEVKKTNSQYYIEKVKILYEELGKTPSSVEYLDIARKRGWTTNYLRYFKQWSDLIYEAKLPPIEIYRKFDREVLRKTFNDCKKELGKVPTCREYTEYCIENKLNTNFLAH